MSELKDSLHKCNDTAAAPDDIHYQILKHLLPDALETLLNIMNEIWRTGKFPEDWHKSVIIPIPKPGKDKTEATNYRLIALTSCICKTMERVINDRLVWFLESNNLISRNQAGFHKNHSTNDHLVRLESFIRDAFVKKEHCVAIFFDLEKAYDTTWKYGIMKEFYKKLTFIPHIKALKAKCLKALDVLKVLSNTSWGGDHSVLLNLYRSLVRSKLNYGSIIFNSSIFTAEAKAIAIALYHIRDQPEKQFIIFSDSLSVLRSLKTLDHRNPLIQQILRKYNYLSAFKDIVFLLASQPH